MSMSDLMIESYGGGRELELGTLAAESYVFSQNYQRGPYSATITASDLEGPYTVLVEGPEIKGGREFATQQAAEFYSHHWLDEVLPVDRDTGEMESRVEMGGIVEPMAQELSNPRGVDVHHPEAYELASFARSHHTFPQGARQWESIITNLEKKKARGTYDPKLATRAFYNLANEAVRYYIKGTDIPRSAFNVGTRWEAAEILQSMWENGEWVDGGRQGNPASGKGSGWEFELLHTLTDYDRKQSTKRGYNHYALAIYMGALERVKEDVRSGRSLRQAIVDNFNDRLRDVLLRAVGEERTTDRERRGNPGPHSSTGVKFVIGFPKRGPRTSKVQSVLFDKTLWTTTSAKRWLRDSGFKAPAVDRSKDYLRFRQLQPGRFKDFRTIDAGSRSKGRKGNPNSNPSDDEILIRLRFAGEVPLRLWNKMWVSGEGGALWQTSSLWEAYEEAKRRGPHYNIVQVPGMGFGVILDGMLERWRKGWKGNPASYPDSESEAAALYQSFHGRPSEQITEIPESEHYHEWLTELGALTEIKLSTPSGYNATIEFSGDDVILSSSEDGRQLYIVGGNQTLDLKPLHLDGTKWRKDLMEIGNIREITYQTEKGFDKFRTIDYFHKLGGETGVLPTLVYDTLNDALKIAGGQYEIKPEGITN